MGDAAAAPGEAEQRPTVRHRPVLLLTIVPLEPAPLNRVANCAAGAAQSTSTPASGPVPCCTAAPKQSSVAFGSREAMVSPRTAQSSAAVGGVCCPPLLLLDVPPQLAL